MQLGTFHDVTPQTRSGPIQWTAAKHGDRAHATRQVVPWQGGATVTAVCGVEFRPSPWPFTLPPSCESCQQKVIP